MFHYHSTLGVPEESEEKHIPKSRRYKLSNRATTWVGENDQFIWITMRFNKRERLASIPKVLRRQQANSRLTYLILPLKRYGQPNLADREGAILQNKIIPFGVDEGTRSRAAESITTYKTKTWRSDIISRFNKLAHIPLLKSPKRKNEVPSLRKSFFSRSGQHCKFHLSYGCSSSVHIPFNFSCESSSSMYSSDAGYLNGCWSSGGTNIVCRVM